MFHVNHADIDRLKTYQAMLHKWQNSVNLVAPSTLSDSWVRHFEDSVQILPHLEGVQTLVDIGSGAGFPGLVVAIAKPDMQVHLIESDGKKCAFLSAVAREVGAKNVHVHNARIEKNLPALRADVVSARALAPLVDLIDWTRSQWGREENPARLVLLKGADFLREIDVAHTRFSFDVQAHKSVTDQDGRILCISGIRA